MIDVFGFYDSQIKLQITESIQNLTLYLVQVFCYFLKFFKVCRMLEKVAEHRSRVPFLVETSVVTSFQSSDGWMFAKTVKWFVGEERKHPVITRKASFKTLNINQVLREQTRLQYSAVESDVLAPAAALRPHVTSAVGQAKFFAQCQT